MLLIHFSAFSGSATGLVPSNLRLFRQPKIDEVD